MCMCVCVCVCVCVKWLNFPYSMLHFFIINFFARLRFFFFCRWRWLEREGGFEDATQSREYEVYIPTRFAKKHQAYVLKRKIYHLHRSETTYETTSVENSTSYVQNIYTLQKIFYIKPKRRSSWKASRIDSPVTLIRSFSFLWKFKFDETKNF